MNVYHEQDGGVPEEPAGEMAWKAAAAKLLSMPMGFAELALAVAAGTSMRVRSDYEKHRLPSCN